MKVIALTALCIDHFPQQEISVPGGNSLNFAIHARNMKMEKVAVAGFLGNDDEAEQILKFLNANKINTDLIYIQQGQTASNKLYNTPDGERYSKPGDWQDGVFNKFTFSEGDYAKIFEFDIIAIPFTDKNLDRLVKRNKSDKKIVVDFLHFDDPEIISKYLPFIEIAFVNAQKQNLEILEPLAHEHEKMLVATLGAEGSLAFYKGEKYFQPAIEAGEVVDTTGCGDAYQAAFSLTYFRKNDIKEAMYEGAFLASKVLKKYGGIG